MGTIKEERKTQPASGEGRDNVTDKARKYLLAAVHIGSEFLSLRLVEYDAAGSLRRLEDVSHPVVLGEETFKTGKIGFAAVTELCGLLAGFKRLLQDYRVYDYRVVATAALREAANRRQVIDQIRVRTGFDVQVLDLSLERFYTHKIVFRTLHGLNLLSEEKPVLFADLTTGGLGLTVYRGETVSYSQSVKVGTLRTKEILGDVQKESVKFQRALEEYIYTGLEPVAAGIAAQRAHYLVAAGAETELLLTLLARSRTPRDTAYISAAEFHALYRLVAGTNVPHIVATFGMAEKLAEKVQPTLALYRHILDLTVADTIIVPPVDFLDGVVADAIDARLPSPWRDKYAAHLVMLAEHIADKYDDHRKHAQATTRFALLLFDKLMKLHGLEARERLLLELAGVMHDIGKYINPIGHYFYSYRLIISSDIMGLSERERTMVANVAYYHSSRTPQEADVNFQTLREEDKVVVAKLAAIIRVADALDRSHRQKVTDLTVRVQEDSITVLAAADEDITLELWTFAQKAVYFAEVFGRTITARQKKAW